MATTCGGCFRLVAGASLAGWLRTGEVTLRSRQAEQHEWLDGVPKAGPARA